MKRRSVFLCALIFVGGIGLFQTDRALDHRRARVVLLREKTLAAEQQLATQRQTLATLSRDLSAAEAHLAALPLYSTPADGADPTSHPPEIAAWLANVRRLKKIFSDHPEQRIPEMRLLTDEDWLRASHRVSLANDEDIRRTLAAVRSAAVARFKVPLLQAFVAYAKAGDKTAPTSATALAPFFANPSDAESLSRYDIVVTNLPKNLLALGAVTWSLLERSAIDEDFDTRHRFNPNGGGSSASGISAWHPDLMERTGQATRAFTAANPAVASPSTSQLLPYFNPPLAPAIAEKLLKAERTRQARK